MNDEMQKEMEKMEARRKKEQRICDLRCHLDATDYKTIKCLAAAALKEDAPYDLAEVEAERQKCRDEINAIQAELVENDA